MAPGSWRRQCLAVAMHVVRPVRAWGLAAVLMQAAAAVAQDAPTVASDPMSRRMVACTSCHGREGVMSNADYLPRIAGKPAAYLRNQLLAFRDGQRTHPAMNHMVRHLDDDDLAEMAQWFAGLRVPYPAPPPASGDAGQMARGRQLALQGDPARGLPACAACHGQRLGGAGPQLGAIPGLLGLPRQYLAAQLGAWQSGQRRAVAPDCMADIARRLTPQDLSAVVAWLAAQPAVLPAAPSPAASPATAGAGTALPLHCGVVQAPALAQASPPPVVTQALSAQAERGRYLARIGNCAACHTTPGGGAYAGGRAIDTPFGRVYSTNLTADAATGLGRWSAEDFWRALHHGRSRDGRLLYPAFPYPNYTRMSRQDADALFAWLRLLPAVHSPARAHELRWPYSTQAALAVWRALYFRAGGDGAHRSTQVPPQVRETAAWQRGAYLVQGVAHCTACHSPRNALGAVDEGLDFAGAQLPNQGWYAPSLTRADEAGVAQWSRQDVVRLLRDGRNAHATTIGPMAEVVRHGTSHMTDGDLDAIAQYLQSLAQPVAGPKRAPVDSAVRDERQMRLGEQVYVRQCAWCHGERGEGRAGAFPALAGNRAVTMDNTVNLVRIVRQGGFGPATAGNSRPHGMPPYDHVLDDARIAAVLSYIRASWGNDAPALTAQDVRRR